jgi:hypothetical protein
VTDTLQDPSSLSGRRHDDAATVCAACFQPTNGSSSFLSWTGLVEDAQSAPVPPPSCDTTALVIIVSELAPDRQSIFAPSDTSRTVRIPTPLSGMAGDAPALCVPHLRETLRRLQNLQAVITVGASAHLALLSACGIPMTRVPYRPGMVTQLPDGLHVAAAEIDGSAHAARRLMTTLAHAIDHDIADAA